MIIGYLLLLAWYFWELYIIWFSARWCRIALVRGFFFIVARSLIFTAVWNYCVGSWRNLSSNSCWLLLGIAGLGKANAFGLANFWSTGSFSHWVLMDRLAFVIVFMFDVWFMKSYRGIWSHRVEYVLTIFSLSFCPNLLLIFDQSCFFVINWRIWIIKNIICSFSSLECLRASCHHIRHVTVKLVIPILVFLAIGEAGSCRGILVIWCTWLMKWICS